MSLSVVRLPIKLLTFNSIQDMYGISMFHHAFFNSIIDKHQHMHFFTFKTVLV